MKNFGHLRQNAGIYQIFELLNSVDFSYVCNILDSPWSVICSIRRFHRLLVTLASINFEHISVSREGNKIHVISVICDLSGNVVGEERVKGWESGRCSVTDKTNSLLSTN